jgi:hypothetical protein
MSPTPAPPRWLAAPLTLAILATTVLITYLAYYQADGWIPALAAARDAVLTERPHTRPFTATFEDLGDQLFPWLPLLDRRPAAPRPRALARAVAARPPSCSSACGRCATAPPRCR